jgi:elongator complex protein 3
MENNANEKIILFLCASSVNTKEVFNSIVQKICKQMKIKHPSNRNLFIAYQKLLKKKRVKKNIQLEFFMRKATIRSLSGVSIITSLMKPHPCPGKCVYCPNEKNMPKSYIATEPAAARALALNFSPYDQMYKRIDMLEANGHATDKIEFIIKGGTLTSYPLKYQYWFILESFKACNNKKRTKKASRISENSLNKITLDSLIKKLEKEQKFNETAGHRIIGITLETRPDTITAESIYHMRKQGCTRIELGLQAPDDKILKLIKRGHTVKQFEDAIFLLRTAGFKVDLHFMPDLPGSNKKHDILMYKKLFSNSALRPDMVKIYPNVVIKSAELYKWFLKGKYKPYGDKQLFEALVQMKLSTPKYCRISRLIRDIPSNEIQAGNAITNLRELLSEELKKQNKKCLCLRCREIGRHGELKKIKPKLFIDKYTTKGGDEYFISFEDKNRTAVFGFLRLRIPKITLKNKKTEKLYEILPEIKNSALIRELHVYGTLVEIGRQNKEATQHKGLGALLLQQAEKIAKQNKFSKIAVISGVGVRGYYKKFGYKKTGTYMIKSV